MNEPRRNTQFDRALRSLRALILAGEFPASKRLPETTLAERLDISRTPLRQAMDRLVDERLLERIETGGCRVASFEMTDILDAIELRGMVEGTAARLAAERGADPGLLEQMRQVVEQLDEAVFVKEPIDFEAYVTHNAEFHRLLAALAGSTVVKREVERMTSLPLASPSAFLQGQEHIPDFQASLLRAQYQHRAIFASIRDREGARAEALTREHARLARENFEYLMKVDPRFVPDVPGLALVSDNANA